MEKRVTIYDIAREAGVSAATVSYVINDREGQSISEETKSKIWHVINMLNYKPNVFAKNLRSASDSKLIAVCTQSRSYSEKAELVSVVEGLASCLRDKFDIIFCMPPFKRITNADAIIAYNVTKETFYQIGNLNYIPLIAVNCFVEDKLFFQVTPDYAKLRSRADAHFCGAYRLVCLPPADPALKAQITEVFPDATFADGGDLGSVTDKNILTVNGVVAEYYASRGANVLYDDLYTPICKQAAECVRMALSHEPYDIHSYRV